MQPPTCDREVNFFGDPINLNRNLIIIKIENTDRYICLTLEEVKHMLTYDQPNVENPNLPAVEQDSLRNYRGVTDKQENPNNWYYQIPTPGQWVDSTFKRLFDNSTNSMILKEKGNRILYKSIGVSGLHDYETNTYYVEEAKRCDFYKNYPDCKEPDEFLDLQDEFITAIKDGDTEKVLDFVRNNKVEPAANNSRALLEACMHNRIEIVRILLEDGRVDPTEDCSYVISEASVKGYTEIVRLLLRDGRANPGDGLNFPIIAAAEQGYTEIVRMLLADPRIDQNAADNNALRSAAKNGHAEIVIMLIADSRFDGQNIDEAISLARANNHLEIVRILRSYQIRNRNRNRNRR